MGEEMSSRGVYSALSGALAQAQRLDTIANNIANVNTPGFKRDDQTFREYLSANEKPSEVLRVPKVPASLESFYDMQGGDTSYVDSHGTYTDFTQGRLTATNQPLDVAIDGSGFFEIMTPGGLRLSRSGGFTLDGNGMVVNKDGFPVLAEAAPGTDPATRVIRVGNDGHLQISENGDVLQGDNVLGKLSVVDVVNKDALRKVGNNLYDFKNGMQPEVQAIANPSLKQGFIETSNVNIVHEMTDMIQASRMFESTQKAIQAYDQISDKLVNIVPKVG